MSRIGLLAGEGKLPIVFARLAKEKGDTVIGFGLKGITDPALENHVEKMHWLNWGAMQAGLLLLATERIKAIIMLGKIKKEKFFKNEKDLDEKAKNMLDKLKEKKDYAILNEVSGMFKKIGVEVIDSTTYLKDLIPSKGMLTKREPTKQERDDIACGKDVARIMAGFDIGQTVAVMDKTIIAIEAMEGTDEVIARAGSLVKSGFTVVKVARPEQDMRFDVPLVGPDTLKIMIRSGGKVLAVEENKTLLLDKEEMVALADENDISIVVI